MNKNIRQMMRQSYPCLFFCPLTLVKMFALAPAPAALP